jgi:hypothetical protein
MINKLINLIILQIGFILGSYFGKLYYDEFTNINHGPNSKNIIKNIYKNKINNTCYKLIPLVHICPSYISMQKKD